LGVSQPLGINDKLREALREAQQILDEAKLTGKIVLTPTTGDGPGSVSSVESSMDRTAKDARDAAEKSSTGDGGGTTATILGSPNDKLLTALDKLIKALDGSSSGGGRGGRMKQSAPGEPPAGPGDDGPGYVNPYILQGLLQNPVGTTQNSLVGMLMGGAGMGLKAPGWLGSMLGGTAGFQPGAALASETGLFASGAAGTFASAGAIAAAKVAVPIAAFMGTMAIQNSYAKDRLQDASDYMNDRLMGQNQGFDWRAGAWNGPMQSRMEIWQKDTRDIISSSGLGLRGMRGHAGDRGIVDAFNGAALEAKGLGISPDQMGGILGAGVRSGTISLQGNDAASQITRYLSLIEGWTSKTASFGFSSTESLQKMAEISQKGLQGTNILSHPALVSLLSMDERARQGLSPELKRGGGNAALGALGAEAQGDTQRVLMMNQFLGADGNLSKEGLATANEAFTPEQVEKVLRRGGKFAGTMIAEALTHTDLGKTRARALGIQQMDKAGFGGAQAMLAWSSGHGFVDDALAYDAAMTPGFLDKNMALGKGDPSGTQVNGIHTGDSAEDSLAKYAQVVTRLSGLTAATAETMQRLDQATTKASRELVNFADYMRNQNIVFSSTPQVFMDAFRFFANGGTGQGEAR
jgi:hypothetical protein